MVMARGLHAGNSEARLLQNLLEACGQCEEVPEAYVDIHTALGGSGVAFVSIVFPSTPVGRPSGKTGPSSSSDSLYPQTRALEPQGFIHRPPMSSAIPGNLMLWWIFEARVFAQF